jgi:hypothetical protein
VPPVPASLASGADGSARFRFSVPLLQHVQAQKGSIRAVVLEGTNARLRRKFTSLVAETVRLELDRMSPAQALDANKTGVSGVNANLMREAQSQAIAGAFLGLVSWWLNSARGLGVDVVDEIFQRSVSPLGQTVSPRI